MKSPVMIAKYNGKTPTDPKFYGAGGA